MKSTYAQILLLLLITSPLLFAQQSLTGQVLDNEGIPLFGANIVIENSSEGTTTDDISAFGNYTWFNRPTGLPGDLNFPQNKVRAGISYLSDKVWNGSLSYQWNQSYTSNNNVFPGVIDAKSLFDLTLGYRLSSTLRFELAGTNLFNNEFRALPGLPKIGRTLTGRFVLDLK